MKPNESLAGDATERFRTTHWSGVFLCAQSQVSGSRTDSANLCDLNLYLVYVTVRQRGYNAEDAPLLKQVSFSCLLERKSFRQVPPEKGNPHAVHRDIHAPCEALIASGGYLLL
jgi:hypothetical protein